MTSDSYPQEAAKFHIQAYQKPKNVHNFERDPCFFFRLPPETPL